MKKLLSRALVLCKSKNFLPQINVYSVVFATLILYGADLLAACVEKETLRHTNKPTDVADKLTESKRNEKCQDGRFSLLLDEDERDEDEDEDEDEDDEDDEEVNFYPNLAGFTISEINKEWTFEPEEKPLAETFASIYTLFDLRLTQNFNFGLEMSFEMGNDGEILEFKDPTINVEALTASFSGEIGGIGIGKYFLLDEIWDRQPGLFGHFISDDLDLDGVLAIRTWLNLGNFMDSEHYLYAGVFFRDTTFLSGSLITSNDRLLKDDGGLANTEQFNNIVISLYGDELPYASAWAYSIGFVHQSPGEDDSNSENSYFFGLYGDFDISDETEFFPFTEFLYRNGADGENQTATTFLVGTTFQHGAWNVGTSYSYRYFQENDSSAPPIIDHNLQVFTSYNFASGFYIDLGYQFLREDETNSHAISLTIGLFFDFSKSFAEEKEGGVAHETDRNKIRQKIRR
jgi:hypothetical protein